MITTHERAPAFVEVFDGDGELFALELDKASDAEIRTAIGILEQRAASLGSDSADLRRVLERRHLDQTVALFRRN
jgi:hypothetical protein